MGALSIGDRLGPYEIFALIGAGGMGTSTRPAIHAWIASSASGHGSLVSAAYSFRAFANSGMPGSASFQRSRNFSYAFLASARFPAITCARALAAST